jgi:hypothetical protein
VQPESWKIGKQSISPVAADELDQDPRGLLFMWERPSQRATYILGVDPTVGKTGWSRWSRVDDDLRIDNAVIQVLRKGNPDVQVAEFAAPVDAVELAPIVNAVGRLYAGSSEEGQAYCIVESTGPGAVTLREMIDKYGYTNLFMWHYYGGSLTNKVAAGKVGWFSSRSANKDLWMRGLHHIHKGRVRVHSEYLVEEMTDCMADSYTLIGEARHGRHDDRVMALLFAIWAAHDWSFGDEPQERAVVEQANLPNWQATDMDVDELTEAWNERMDQLSRD